MTYNFINKRSETGWLDSVNTLRANPRGHIKPNLILGGMKYQIRTENCQARKTRKVKKTICEKLIDSEHMSKTSNPLVFETIQSKEIFWLISNSVIKWLAVLHLVHLPAKNLHQDQVSKQAQETLILLFAL